MYGNCREPENSVNLSTIDSAFDDINRSSVELAELLNSFNEKSNANDAQNILVKVNVLLGYMIAVRNQLLLFKRHSSIAGNATAKEYLNELKVQMDGLKSITYSYGSIFSSLAESRKLDQKMS